PMEERFAASLKLAELPRNSAPTRIRNRCEITGRPRAYYRKLKMSRLAPRELGSKGMIPGLVKSSWEGGSHHVNARSARRHAHAHPKRAGAQQVQGLDTRLEAARTCARGAQERGLYPRLCQRRAQGRPHRIRDRAEIFRWRAGDPRDLAGVEAGPARLC